ncbi:hypothetical protein CEXT_760471 [Caerostris extrusa]|uniref:Uncharacterized protein n=1 Tax=Caerostris extrusa TaxID=172846 RepID=A0AAV4Q345_CAEEX|nr:hypothetical protein CEXT_760471 [Caerostris extrusa]
MNTQQHSKSQMFSDFLKKAISTASLDDILFGDFGIYEQCFTLVLHWCLASNSVSCLASNSAVTRTSRDHLVEILDYLLLLTYPDLFIYFVRVLIIMLVVTF